MKTLEHIEDYLLGNLSAEEQKAFEAKLANDKELQEQVELHRILITEVQAFNAVQAAEAAYLKEQQEPIGTKQDPSPKVITWNFKRIASIAACFLIVMGGYNVWLQQYTIDIGEHMTFRGGNNIAALIENEKYDEALKDLNLEIAKIDKHLQNTNNPKLRESLEELLFDKAKILLMQGERKQAKQILKDIKAYEELDKLHWYSPIINLFEK
jgi:hypothetical protein